MSHKIQSVFCRIDWVLIGSVLAVSILGLLTMQSFSAENYFFEKQLVWLGISFSALFILSSVNLQFLRRTVVVTIIFILAVISLLAVFVLGEVTQGSQRWLEIGGFSIQVSEFAKIALIIVLAKYFSRRHVEIADFRHIIISGIYAFIIFSLIFFQPDFGSSVVIIMIWLGMILVSGISKKHLLIVGLSGLIVFGGLWLFAFEDYQKNRIVSFLQPYADMEGGGYHTLQSTIAVGSGGLSGKGVGYGTQSHLKFLPEHETDFIFAAFAEEWGFLGVFFLFFLFGLIIWRIFANSLKGATNFEVLFGVGLATMIMCHIFIHIGANVGILPVTGITLPFMSFGGSHLLATFIGLGILMSIRRHNYVTHKDIRENEMLSDPYIS